MVYSNRPDFIKTGIFLDSGDPAETKLVLDELGFLDGQTTNPSLVAKNPDIRQRIDSGERLTTDELLGEYKKIINEIYSLIPGKSISIEVYADKNTTAEEMIEQAQEMNGWIDSAHIKLPTTFEGLKAARHLIDNDYRVNMTLVFKQEQAAAVHAATMSAKRGSVYVSPFIGRLDDIELRGIDVVTNITKMFRDNNSHVEVLSASIRSLDHLLFLMFMHADIVTVPYKVLKKWIRLGAPNPERSDISVMERTDMGAFFFNGDLQEIPFERIAIDNDYSTYNIAHKLTEVGLQKFANDWNDLLR